MRFLCIIALIVFQVDGQHGGMGSGGGSDDCCPIKKIWGSRDPMMDGMYMNTGKRPMSQLPKRCNSPCVYRKEGAMNGMEYCFADSLYSQSMCDTMGGMSTTTSIGPSGGQDDGETPVDMGSTGGPDDGETPVDMGSTGSTDDGELPVDMGSTQGQGENPVDMGMGETSADMGGTTGMDKTTKPSSAKSCGYKSIMRKCKINCTGVIEDEVKESKFNSICINGNCETTWQVFSGKPGESIWVKCPSKDAINPVKLDITCQENGEWKLSSSIIEACGGGEKSTAGMGEPSSRKTTKGMEGTNYNTKVTTTSMKSHGAKQTTKGMETHGSKETTRVQEVKTTSMKETEGMGTTKGQTSGRICGRKVIMDNCKVNCEGMLPNPDSGSSFSSSCTTLNDRKECATNWTVSFGVAGISIWLKCPKDGAEPVKYDATCQDNGEWELSSSILEACGGGEKSTTGIESSKGGEVTTQAMESHGAKQTTKGMEEHNSKETTTGIEVNTISTKGNEGLDTTKGQSSGRSCGQKVVMDKCKVDCEGMQPNPDSHSSFSSSCTTLNNLKECKTSWSVSSGEAGKSIWLKCPKDSSEPVKYDVTCQDNGEWEISESILKACKED